MIKKEEKGVVGQTKEVPVGPPKLIESPLPAVVPSNPIALPKHKDTFPKLPKTPRFHPIKYEEVMREKARKKALKEKIKFFKKSEKLRKQELKEAEIKKKTEPPKVIKKKKELSKEDKDRIKKGALIILLLIVAVALIIIYFLSLKKESPTKQLIVGENIDYAYIQGDVIYLRFLPVDFSTIDEIEFIVTDNQGANNAYTAYYLELDHELYPDNFNLDNLDSIEAVAASFNYKPLTPAPKPDVNESTNQTPPAPKPTQPTGGGGGGGPITPPAPSCTNDAGCSSVGDFCNNQMPYNCSLGSDGCYDRTNKTVCGAGQECLNGECQIISDCTSDFECTSYFDECSYGVCNSTGKCEFHYNSSGVCRPAPGECDVPESCTGSSFSCPVDVNKTGDSCTTSGNPGICEYGVCIEVDTCGNSVCDSGEDCSSCPGDCACVAPTPHCNSGTCVECLDNGHCNAGEVCSSNICVPQASQCNDGVLDAGELCDRDNFGEKTCVDFFIHGKGDKLTCCEGCDKVNLRQCTNYTYILCTDADGGINYDRPSSASASFQWKNGPNCTSDLSTSFGAGGQVYPDACEGDILVEYYCEDNNYPAFIRYNCSSEGKTCRYGACYEPIFPTASFWEGLKELIKRI